MGLHFGIQLLNKVEISDRSRAARPAPARPGAAPNGHRLYDERVSRIHGRDVTGSETADGPKYGRQLHTVAGCLTCSTAGLADGLPRDRVDETPPAGPLAPGAAAADEYKGAVAGGGKCPKTGQCVPRTRRTEDAARRRPPFERGVTREWQSNVAPHSLHVTWADTRAIATLQNERSATLERMSRWCKCRSAQREYAPVVRVMRLRRQR